MARVSGIGQHRSPRIAQVFRLAEKGTDTQLSFRVRGELRDVPVPLLYRIAAPAFIQGRFQNLVETFLERTREAVLGGEVAAAPKKARR